MAIASCSTTRLLSNTCVYTRFSVIADPLFEKVCLSTQRDHLHPVKGVGVAIVFGRAKSDEETVGYESDVLAHEVFVHSNELDGECLRQELYDVVKSVKYPVMSRWKEGRLTSHSISTA